MMRFARAPTRCSPPCSRAAELVDEFDPELRDGAESVRSRLADLDRASASSRRPHAESDVDARLVGRPGRASIRSRPAARRAFKRRPATRHRRRGVRRRARPSSTSTVASSSDERRSRPSRTPSGMPSASSRRPRRRRRTGERPARRRPGPPSSPTSRSALLRRARRRAPSPARRRARGSPGDPRFEHPAGRAGRAGGCGGDWKPGAEWVRVLTPRAALAGPGPLRRPAAAREAVGA